jgi:hypothetical protein
VVEVELHYDGPFTSHDCENAGANSLMQAGKFH